MKIDRELHVQAAKGRYTLPLLLSVEVMTNWPSDGRVDLDRWCFSMINGHDRQGSLASKRKGISIAIFLGLFCLALPRGAKWQQRGMAFDVESDVFLDIRVHTMQSTARSCYPNQLDASSQWSTCF